LKTSESDPLLKVSNSIVDDHGAPPQRELE